MKTTLINRSDWTGRLTYLTVFKDGRFKMRHIPEYIFWLEDVTHPEMAYLDKAWTIRGSNWDPDYSLGTVYDNGEDRPQNLRYTAMSMDLMRSADCPYAAAAMVLCNTI